MDQFTNSSRRDLQSAAFAKYGIYGADTKAAGTSTAEPAPAGPAHTQYPTEPYPAVAPDNTKAINDMFDANINAQKTALQESGDQALSDAQANRDNIAKIYQQQRNASAVDWERQRRNFLEGANTSGINTGAGSQAELSMMGMQQRSQNSLGAAQAGAEVEADRNIADIRRNTQNAINEAIAENDYKRAAALLDDYNLQYNRAMARAQDLAAFGDFSGYAAIYGEAQANSMWTSWVAQNPQVAYMMGQITADQYSNLKAGKPINDGLDANGVRIVNPLAAGLTGGGSGSLGSGRSQQDIFYEESTQLKTPDANGVVSPERFELAAEALDAGNRA